MKKNTFDIDLDVADRDKALFGLKYVSAVINDEGIFKKHVTGVYFQDIPSDIGTGIATMDFKAADELGFFKIDFLNMSLYSQISSEQELICLMHEPNWSLLEDEQVASASIHIGDHLTEVMLTKPKSVEQLAMLLAMIRPAKRYLLGKSWNDIEKEVWVVPVDGSYYFKKSHAISYAMAIVVQLNMIARQRSPVL